jgi:predicted AlkP superfamily phosphohydrolase/phosphomutase
MILQRSSPRMLIIGLDAADPALIEKWSDAGILPTLQHLRNKGAWIRLNHGGEFPSASIWPTIFTGTHPGKHGIYHTVPIMPGEASFGNLKPERCGQRPFWCDLERQGKRCVLLDLPFSYPRTDLSALQISNWGSYERFAPPGSAPRDVLLEIIARFGRYPFGGELSRDVPLTERELWSTRRQLLVGTALKGKVINWLISNRPWDFFMTVFGEPHAAGHYFWKFSSDKHARGFSHVPGEFATSIRDVYRAADRELGRIVETLHNNTILLVLSGQGMGPNYVGWHLIPEVLAKLRLTVGNHANGNRAKIDRLAKVRSFIFPQVRRALSRHLPDRLRDYLQLRWAASNIDWSQSQIFDLPTDSLGFLRVNLKGREPNGIVEPGKEYDELCQRISETFKQLVNPRTGKKVARKIFLTDHVFPGPERDRLPDMIIDWNDGTEIDGAYSSEIGTIEGTSPDPRQGNHRPEGFALAYGPSIRSGYVAYGHILDIAPTVLNCFGLKPTPYMDGRPWTGLFDFQSKGSLQRTSSWA